MYYLDTSETERCLRGLDTLVRGGYSKGKMYRDMKCAQYTREFAVGYFHPYEYVYKDPLPESINSQIALVLAKMVNLKIFIWDRPSMLSKYIWNALSSLADDPGCERRLERVWIRCHDSDEGKAYGYFTVDYPTLSVLPALKSLTVLNINKPSCLEEMALSIERSRHQLRELRVGMSSRVKGEKWTKLSNTLLLQRQRNIPGKWPKPGGVLEVLSGSFKPQSAGVDGSNAVENQKGNPENGGPHLLKLELLELKRAHLSIPIIMQAIDWTWLTTLTILRYFGCAG